MLVVVDYHLGNMRSIVSKLNFLKIEAQVSSDPEVISKASKLILPGVGAFSKGMDNLKKLNLIDILNQKVLTEKTPILGICLGLQLFSKASDEGGQNLGLGWIDAVTAPFQFADKSLRVPHVGWNSLKRTKPSKIFTDIPEDTHFYFTHSYHLKGDIKNPEVLTLTDYGYEFISSVEHGNIIGCQFHPEKSRLTGIKILENFVRYY